MPSISSAELDAFATFPQCLDNQFLPRQSLEDVAREQLGADKAARARIAAARREYVRSLIYSPEVVINRAYAVNEPAVFEDLRTHPASIAQLIDNHRLTILLLKGETGLDHYMATTPSELNNRGKKAWTQLLTTYGDASQRYLRLSDEESGAITDRFPLFIRQFMRLEVTDEQLLGLFKATALGAATHSKLEDFKRYLSGAGEDWLRTRPVITRSTFYQNFVMPDGADISRPGIDPRKPFAFELKLIADLAYNANTPVTLSRQSFIPTSLPSPLCLPIALFPRKQAVSQLDRVAARDVCDRALAESGWYYESQAYFSIPDWAELTASDVCVIQAWPEWTNFRVSQRAVADAPTAEAFDARLSEFFTTLESFQRRLAYEIDTPSASLHHIKQGAKVLKLIVRPLVSWAGRLLGPEWAKEIITDVSLEGIDFAIDIGINFLDRRHDQKHQAAAESYISRVEGVRQNIAANISETSSHRRALEIISERPAESPEDQNAGETAQRA